jgi:hypothetical protein
MVGVRDPDGNVITLHKRKTTAEQRAAERQARAKKKVPRNVK